MLPRRYRLRERSDFVRVARGRRTGSSLVQVHAQTGEGTGSPRVGFAVSRKVGNAVVRNRTKRRLRAATLPMITRLSSGTDVMVRALPPASTVTLNQLAADLERLLDRLGCLSPRPTGGVEASANSCADEKYRP